MAGEITQIECATKLCAKCCQQLVLDRFHFRKDTGKHRSTCKSCWREKTDAWAAENQERRREIALKWAKNNYPKIRKNKARYRKEDPDRMRKWERENPDLKRKINAEWKRNNKGAVVASTRRRQAAKSLATPSWANQGAITAVYMRAAEMRSAGVDVHVDHIVPLRGEIVCGLHVENNLQIISAMENLLKGNRVWPDMP